MPAPTPTMAKRKPKKVHPNAIHLTVQSVPRAAQFYVDKLGFKLAGTYPDGGRPIFAKLVLGGQVVMLGELPSLQEAKQMGMDAAEIELLKQDARAFARGTPGVGCACFLQVKDVDAFARRLKNKRVRPLTPPKTQFYGIRECQLADLDGYRLVFYSPAEVPAAPPAEG
ncbi:MAG: hypothetical protein FJ265_21890 [Planctomycetes bacterium]|nr:hypothetical protein [Planctomycetota bacterium]